VTSSVQTLLRSCSGNGMPDQGHAARGEISRMPRSSREVGAVVQLGLAGCLGAAGKLMRSSSLGGREDGCWEVQAAAHSNVHALQT
jgi:hypothetical protein